MRQEMKRAQGKPHQFGTFKVNKISLWCFGNKQYNDIYLIMGLKLKHMDITKLIGYIEERFGQISTVILIDSRDHNNFSYN